MPSKSKKTDAKAVAEQLAKEAAARHRRAVGALANYELCVAAARSRDRYADSAPTYAGGY